MLLKNKIIFLAVGLFLCIVCVVAFNLNRQRDSLDIIIISKSADVSVDFWRVLMDGMEAACNDNNIEYDYRAVEEESDVAGQIELIEVAILEKPDIIVLAATSYKELSATLQKAVDSGIEIVFFDSGASFQDQAVKGVVQTDSFSAAQNFGKISQEYGDKALILSHDVENDTGITRETGFREGFEQEGKEVVTTIDCKNNEQITIDEATSILGNGNIYGIDVIFATNEVTAKGVQKVIETYGLGEQIFVTAFDASTEQISALETGAIDLLHVQKAFNIGYLTIETAIESYNKQPFNYQYVSGIIVNRDMIYDREVQEILFPFINYNVN